MRRGGCRDRADRNAAYPLVAQTLFYNGQPVIEARLRLPAAMILYEVCRVQKLGPSEMGARVAGLLLPLDG